MPSWLPPWTPPSPSQFRSPPFVDRNSHPGFHPTNVYPSLVPPLSLSLAAFSMPCYYQPPPPSPSPSPLPPEQERWYDEALRGGALGRKGKFLVRVQTHWRLLSCCRHVLRGVTEKGGGGKQPRRTTERERKRKRVE